MVFLATFLVGFLAFQASVLLEQFTLSKTESQELIHTLSEVDTPRIGQDRAVEIDYLDTNKTTSKFEAEFKVTNLSAEEIRFKFDENDRSSHCNLHEGKHPRAFSVGSVECAIERTSLAPFESTIVRAPVEPNDKAYLLYVRYFVGPKMVEVRSGVWVNIPEKDTFRYSDFIINQ